MHTMLKNLLLPLLLTPALIYSILPVRADDELTGRLFTTPAERERIDMLRQRQKPRVAARPGLDAASGSTEPMIEEATLDGIVTRSSGKNTTWINQNPESEKQLGASLQVVQVPGRAAQLLMRTQNGKQVRVKVGDTVDLRNGKVRKVDDPPPVDATPAPITQP